MQALGSKVLLEYSHLAAGLKGYLHRSRKPCSMHPFRALVKLAKKACAELKVIDGKDTCEKGNPNSLA